MAMTVPVITYPVSVLGFLVHWGSAVAEDWMVDPNVTAYEIEQ